MCRIVAIILLGLMCMCGFAQTTEDKYQRPLIDVLNDIQSRFGVRLKIPDGMVDGKVLDYADWRIRPYSVEQSLSNVLAPFDLKFVKDGDKVYKIKNYEYARRLPEDGQQMIDYLKTLYNDQSSWEKRKAELSSCVHSTLGLNPMPVAVGSKPILTSKRIMNGYTVENFALETLPGVYVCGSLYRPLKAKGLQPVILCPNGHFYDARYRADQQYRCAMLAKMGAMTVSYDLFAWGESMLQFKYEEHRQSIALSIQALNGIRILDWLLTLKGADAFRVGITGGSGGGSQTMLLGAIDPRFTVSAPVVSVSSYFVGGCPCESGLPIHLCGGGTTNAEFAAMFAPKPQILITDGADWSKDTPEIEYPYLQYVYGFYNQTGVIENAHFPKEGHDYGVSKRKAMYPFFAKHLKLDLSRVCNKDGQIDETTVTIEPKEAMYVFGEKGEKLPANAIKGLDQLKKVWNERYATH